MTNSYFRKSPRFGTKQLFETNSIYLLAKEELMQQQPHLLITPKQRYVNAKSELLNQKRASGSPRNYGGGFNSPRFSL